MLSDYIPVYWPESNTFSIPNYELETYKDYMPEPQHITLYKGHVVRGIPLLHFGTWGAFGVNVTEAIRATAKDPEGVCANSFRSEKVAAKTASFFKALTDRYPNIVSVERFRSDADGNSPSDDLGVPADCIIKYTAEKR